MKSLVSLATLVLGPKTRVRLRGHYGATPMEIIYNLMTFGINPDMLPFTAEGRFNLKHHDAFIQQHIADCWFLCFSKKKEFERRDQDMEMSLKGPLSEIDWRFSFFPLSGRSTEGGLCFFLQCLNDWCWISPDFLFSLFYPAIDIQIQDKDPAAM